MKFKKILLFGYQTKDLDKSIWSRIDKLCEKKIILPKDSPDLNKNLPETDCLLVNQGMAVDKTMMDLAPELKFVGILATGYNKIDIGYAKKKEITVCNVPGYAKESVAEFVFGAAIEQLRELERAKFQARNGDYSELSFNGSEIKDKKFAVVGLGRIGSRVAEIAKLGFQAETIYWSRNRKKEVEKLGVKYTPLKSLLSEADIISLHLAFAPETTEILNEKTIGLIKPGALLINFAPMELINLKALVKRLKKGDIAFIFDHSDEITTEQIKMLKPYKNCIFYPPIGFRTKEAVVLKQEIFVSNLKNFLNGKPTNRVS